MIKIKYTCFWPDFNPNDFFINDMIQKDYKIVTDDSYDVIVMSVFNYQNLKVKDNSIKILFNGEHPSYIDRFLQVTGIKLNLIIGFITSNQILGTMQVYYPLWITYYDKIYSQEYFDKANNNLKNINLEDLSNKKFCCLINSHDTNNTRLPIYTSLIKYGKIDCPGRLLHNVSDIGPERENKIKFMKNYIFNICSENGIGVGYFTEKLPQCVDALCLPVYSGDINKFNSNIFNIKRIITDCDKVQELIKDKQKLVDFYQQDIYNKDAYKYIINIQNIVKLAINNLLKN